MKHLKKQRPAKGKPTAVIIADTLKVTAVAISVMENKADWHHKVPTQEECIR